MGGREWERKRKGRGIGEEGEREKRREEGKRDGRR